MKQLISAPRLAIVLARCWRAVSQVAEGSVREAGMCLTDFVALEALLHKGPLTITEIQEKVQLASGSMTAAVDRLEKKGFNEYVQWSGKFRPALKGQEVYPRSV